MKKAVSFIKNRVITGVVVIVPIAVIGIIMSGAIKKLITVTSPFTSNMQIGGTLFRTIIATILLIIILGLFFFVGGLILKTYLGNRFKNWLKRTILENIPFFSTLNSVVHQITGVEKGNYAAVEVSLYDNENKLLGIHTETLSDGRFIVYIPFAPVVTIGQVYIVNRENVKVLDISLKEFMDIISKIGFEANKIYVKKSNAEDTVTPI
ncbi:MAG: hypothetical protein K8R74_11560 [Bacteroidales bacterium]|nr:hypothetical protein [Bacteroidales bacterium]